MSLRLKRLLYWTGSACCILTAIFLPLTSPWNTERIVYLIIGLLIVLAWWLAFLGGTARSGC